MTDNASPSLSLFDVFHALRGQVGAWSVRGWLSAALGLLLYRRLGEMMGRMERLTARFRAGRLRRPGPRAVRPVAAVAVRADVGQQLWPRDPTAKLPRDPTAKLPRRFGWLVRAASWHAAAYTGQLRLVLAQPEMVALLAATPQAARILRPLCRMLAVETALLHPRVEGAAVAEPAAETVAVKVPRVRAPRVPVDWGRIPLPRGVLTAARRGGFAKG